MVLSLKENKDISLVLCGEAGQGIQTVEQILVRAFKMTGYNVSASKEYMSRVRGGENSTQIRVSSRRVAAFLDRTDILVALSPGAVNHMQDRINSHTIVIGDQNDVPPNHVALPLMEIAKKIGGPLFANIIAAGIVSQMLEVDIKTFNQCLEDMFARKGEKILQKDIEAGKHGYQLGQSLNKIKIKKNSSLSFELLLNGSEAVALGSIAGGCRFISSYPMTPSTPVQTFLAEHASSVELVFEQAEDEIAALNMALGASYAGARSMVATSGSGFALMEEAVGLSGMTETPI
ncbi:MAG TPA: 2-oxoacid:acceptor oxidoreductase family protein, partial [Methanobacteriaceae archaeon]|nr:2-oxoacid:acceptor oxidoreductase family protein [Methanobacteriaceae archaeon]